MIILLRYACLLALGGAASVAFFGAMTATGHMFLEAPDAATVGHRDAGIWIITALMALALTSALKFTFGRIPGLMRHWLKTNRDRMASLLLMALFGAVFLLA